MFASVYLISVTIRHSAPLAFGRWRFLQRGRHMTFQRYTWTDRAGWRRTTALPTSTGFQWSPAAIDSRQLKLAELAIKAGSLAPPVADVPQPARRKRGLKVSVDSQVYP